MASRGSGKHTILEIFLYETEVILGISLVSYIGYTIIPLVDGFPIIYLFILLVMGASLYLDNGFYTDPYHEQDFLDAKLKVRIAPAFVFTCIGLWIPGLICRIEFVSKARFRRDCGNGQIGEQFFWFLVILLGASIFRLIVGYVILGYKAGVKGVSWAFGLKD